MNQNDKQQVFLKQCINEVFKNQKSWNLVIIRARIWIRIRDTSANYAVLCEIIVMKFHCLAEAYTNLDETGIVEGWCVVKFNNCLMLMLIFPILSTSTEIAMRIVSHKFKDELSRTFGNVWWQTNKNYYDFTRHQIHFRTYFVFRDITLLLPYTILVSDISYM
jgi:hypothetical protein